MSNFYDICRAQLPIDEGDKDKPYKDQNGNITIGVGRNLSANGIRPDEKRLMFENDLLEAEAGARTVVPSFDELSDNRKAVLMNMAFNMGADGLSRFKKMRQAIADKDFTEAARQMRSSLWFAQVQRSRSERLITMMEKG